MGVLFFLREVMEVFSPSRPFTEQYEPFYPLRSVTRAGQRGGPFGQLPTVLRRHWSNRKYGTGKHRCFHTRKNFSEKLYAICPRSPKVQGQPCPMPREFKECRFKGRQIISLPGASTCLRPAVSAILICGNSTLKMGEDK